MKKIILTKVNVLLASILSLLGFQSCGSSIFEQPCLYGSPHADFEVIGSVTDEAGNVVEGEKIIVRQLLEHPDASKSDTFKSIEDKTNDKGKYTIQFGSYPNMNKVRVVAIDSTDKFENDSTEITLQKVEDGNEDFYYGKFAGTKNFTLKKKVESTNN